MLEENLPVIWRCADGRRMQLHEMKDSHLDNCIAMVRRGHQLGRPIGPKTRERLPALLAERDRRDIRAMRFYRNKLWG